MHNKGCPSCGSDQHDVTACPWPMMMVFSIMGAAIAGCILNMIRPA
jgi:uncharacterized protein (DUF983 family)